MEITRKSFLDRIGGPEAVDQMDSEARADALEHQMLSDLNSAIAFKQSTGHEAPKMYPTVAEVEAQIETRPYRRVLDFCSCRALDKT